MTNLLRAALSCSAWSLELAVSQPPQRWTRLAVVERAATDVVTDTGDSGDTVGDILTFANEVYDEANANEVGTTTAGASARSSARRGSASGR